MAKMEVLKDQKKYNPEDETTWSRKQKEAGITVMTRMIGGQPVRQKVPVLKYLELLAKELPKLVQLENAEVSADHLKEMRKRYFDGTLKDAVDYYNGVMQFYESYLAQTTRMNILKPDILAWLESYYEKENISYPIPQYEKGVRATLAHIYEKQVKPEESKSKEFNKGVAECSAWITGVKDAPMPRIKTLTESVKEFVGKSLREIIKEVPPSDAKVENLKAELMAKLGDVTEESKYYDFYKEQLERIELFMLEEKGSI